MRIISHGNNQVAGEKVCLERRMIKRCMGNGSRKFINCLLTKACTKQKSKDKLPFSCNANMMTTSPPVLGCFRQRHVCKRIYPALFNVTASFLDRIWDQRTER